MFKEYGFLTNKPTYNKLWNVCSQIYTTASETMLADLTQHYLDNGEFPDKDLTIEDVLTENLTLANNFAERVLFIKDFSEEVEYLSAEEIFEL